MDDSFSMPSEGGLLSQILGVKTSLCFRPRKSTQKPHAVLRRVEPSDDSSDEGEELSSLVQFKIFAQKRFTITPGKEILLTIEDDRFKDHAVLLCGTALTSEESDVQERFKAVQEGDIPPPPKNALPPKMRRAWVKKPDKGSTAARISIGIQATPTTCSTDVQAQPPSRTVSIQSNPSSASASVQTLHPTRSVLVQAELAPCLAIDTSVQPTPRAKERSLSPMELDSPDPDSTSSSLGTPQSKSSPFPSSGIPPFFLTPDHRPALPDDDEEVDMQISPKAISSQSITVDNPDHSIVSLQTQTLHPESSSPSTKSILPYPTDNNTSGALKGVYRKSVYNPFVSAGFVTEFTGDSCATTGQAKGLGIIKNSPPNFPGAVKRAEASDSIIVKSTSNTNHPLGNSAKTSFDVESTNTSPPARTNPLVQEEECTNDSLLKENPRSSGDFKNQEAKHASIPTGPRNAVASSSKVLLEHAKPMSNTSRASRSLRNQVDEPVPNRNSQAVLSSSSPYNNPLGIKPSRPITPTLTPAPAGSRILAGIQTKKRVVVGVGTPMAKAMADADSHPSPFCPQSMPKTSNLVAYSSPSPPVAPTPAPPADSPKHPPSPVQNKWKRLPSIDTTSPTVSAKGQRNNLSLLLII
ncbi:hypothetical protein DFH05DRAFT_737235 [Lentinula detonsa]|uniref:Uncharacterized protein n=1 Tax=Lentinula detonsa TaxID=2804962 RepID=A0A9W8TT17_9AGAR|nr:hypothetical protein DFH05DRAFT_737235 [Lentinula detonsa]